jgi:hypothetical protein
MINTDVDADVQSPPTSMLMLFFAVADAHLFGLFEG